MLAVFIHRIIPEGKQKCPIVVVLQIDAHLCGDGRTGKMPAVVTCPLR